MATKAIKERHIVLGVHVTDRVSHVIRVQDVLTEFGGLIRTRLGLHHVASGYSSPNGLILLELLDDPARCAKLVAKLRKIAGVGVKQMVFTH